MGGIQSIAILVGCFLSIMVSAQPNNEMAWWNGLSQEWQEAFRKNLRLKGTIYPNTVQMIWQLRELDVSGNQNIRDLSPLKPLKNLQKLYSNNTAITSLSPISELVYLEVVEFQGTNVRNLKPLTNLTELRRVNAAKTSVKKIAVLSQLKKIEIILCMETDVSRRNIQKFLKIRPNCRVIRDYLN